MDDLLAAQTVERLKKKEEAEKKKAEEEQIKKAIADRKAKILKVGHPSMGRMHWSSLLLPSRSLLFWSSFLFMSFVWYLCCCRLRRMQKPLPGARCLMQSQSRISPLLVLLLPTVRRPRVLAHPTRKERHHLPRLRVLRNQQQHPPQPMG